jgi:hypothetical protein
MSIINPRPPRGSSAKVILWDYDFVLSRADRFCSYCLSDKHVAIINAIIDSIAWGRRWVSPTETEIDTDTLLNWQGGLVRALMTGCCDDEVVLHRITDDGQMQISTDGGATWTQDPADPRVTGTQLPNTIIGTGDDKKCNAATNAVENIKDAQAAWASSISEATTIIGLALEFGAALIVLLFTVGTTAEILIPLMIGAASALFGVLETDYNALFTSDVWDTLTCLIFCRIGDDGQFTTSTYNDLQADIDGQGWDDRIVQTFQTCLTGWGLVGLNNACIAGTAATADCADCDCGEWCYEFDFTTSDGGWTASTYGSWSPGGWEGTTAGTGVAVAADKTTATTTITHAEMDVTADVECNVAITLDGVFTLNTENVVTGTYSWDGTASGTLFELNPSSGVAQGAQVTMTRVLFRGTGVNPFGTDNCT